MRPAVRFYILLQLLAVFPLGCATTSSSPPHDFTGTWVGRLEASSSLLARGGVVSGFVRIELEQRGRWLSGELVGPGIRGHLNATVDGMAFWGDLLGWTLIEGGEVPVTGRLEGDRLVGTLDGSPWTVRRVA